MTIKTTVYSQKDLTALLTGLNLSKVSKASGVNYSTVWHARAGDKIHLVSAEKLSAYLSATQGERDAA